MLDKTKVKIKVGGDFEPLPNDKYTAQITDVSLVTQVNNFKGIEEDLLNYQFTILDEKQTADGESTRGRLVWQRVSMSLSARSKLGKLATAVVGRELTKEEKESFDPEALIGKQVDIMVVQNPDKNDSSIIYNNVISVNKVLKKLKTVDAIEKPAPIVKKTVAAVAPDTEDPETFIENLEAEAKGEEVDISQKESTTTTRVAAAQTAEELDAEMQALEAEEEEAALRAKNARARAALAKKKAALTV